MPANRDLPSQYKIYTGRTFILRKHNLIPASKDRKARTRKIYKGKERFGEACLVLDETNSRVKITTLDGNPMWISKFYLLKEIVSDSFKDYDYITALANELINSEDPKQQEAGKALKQYADVLKPINKKE
jgi:hypothetical protein